MASDEDEEYADVWEALGKMPFVIWFCPDNREHKRKHGRNAPPRPTVEWIDGVAYCLEPNCGKKSTDPKGEPMSKKTLEEMTKEVREVNTEKGWREPGKTWGDYIALLHTEAGEATDAFRAWGLKDATGPSGKPEGVGPELADILIRLLDSCDVIGVPVYGDPYGFDETLETIGVWSMSKAIQTGLIPTPLVSFGDCEAFLHRCIDRMWSDPTCALDLLRAINTVAQRYGFDLMAEYERKQAHNRTRDYRHGGKLI